MVDSPQRRRRRKSKPATLFWEDLDAPASTTQPRRASPVRVASPLRPQSPRGSCSILPDTGRLGFIEDDDEVLRSPRRHSSPRIARQSVSPVRWNSSPKLELPRGSDVPVISPRRQRPSPSPRAGSPQRRGRQSPPRASRRESQEGEYRSRFHQGCSYWVHEGADLVTSDFQSSLRTYFPSPKKPEPTVVQHSEWHSPRGESPRQLLFADPASPRSVGRAGSPSSAERKAQETMCITQLRQSPESAAFMSHLREYDPTPPSAFHKRSPRYPPPVFIVPAKSELRRQHEQDLNCSLPLRREDGSSTLFQARHLGQDIANSQFLASLRSPDPALPSPRSRQASHR